ncbi:MAG: hypothetical protein JO237_04110 [Pseudolabrys sp.]|nr:hypothetical protein [Pseudolabrys sp.]
MKGFLYRCPTTGLTVQGLAPDDAAPTDSQAVKCLACGRIHLAKPLAEERAAKNKADEG